MNCQKTTKKNTHKNPQVLPKVYKLSAIAFGRD